MDPTLIADLIHAGVAPELVARVANAMVTIAAESAKVRGLSADSATEKRRAYDRERARKTRENRRISADVGGLSENALTKESTKDIKKESKRRGERISADWKPSETDSEFALSKGMSRERTATEAEKFRNYWLAKSGASASKLDWNATWKNWVLQSIERVPGNPPPASIDTEPSWKKPPWEREGITETFWRERELGKINGTQVWRDAGMGKNGADRSSELPLSGGGALRESNQQARGPPDDFP